jgi:glycosyltransferase involved in cell wall biosynthesis
VKKKYILITPAYNEEDNIERVINSIIVQTIPPQKWLIVNDGSTDRTGEIIERYEAKYDFISCLRLKREYIKSYYGRRTQVVLAGYEKIKKLEFNFLGILDADISCRPTYYEDIMKEFEANAKLGLAGGKYVYKFGSKIQQVLIDDSCVPGSIQMFRRQCYEQIGGYVPLEYGGDDSLADIMVRMHGWETRSFSKYQVIQHRIVGTAGKSVLKAKFRQGFTEYGVATHPLFMLAKSLRRVFLERPFFFGSAARMAGFLYAYLQCGKRSIPDDIVSFVRKEQIARLMSYVRGTE